MRERELKRQIIARLIVMWRSLPMRERELKPQNEYEWWVEMSRSPCGSAN